MTGPMKAKCADTPTVTPLGGSWMQPWMLAAKDVASTPDGSLDQKLQSLLADNADKLTSIWNDGQTNLLTVTPGKEASSHCFRSVGLSQHWSWSLEGKGMHNVGRAMQRIQETEMFSMRVEAYPLNGVAGAFICHKGSFFVLLLPAERAQAHADLQAWLRLSQTDGETLEHEACAVMKENDVVFVPYGWIAITVALSSTRSSLASSISMTYRQL